MPATESSQMVEAVRRNEGTAWHLLARDEGHGFARKPNQDHPFLAAGLFLRQHLLP